MTGLRALIGLAVRFEWAAGMKADLHWGQVYEARVLDCDAGMLLLHAQFCRERWWPVTAFAWVEHQQDERRVPPMTTALERGRKSEDIT